MSAAPRKVGLVQVFRSFLFAPGGSAHRREIQQLEGFLAKLSTAEVMEGAYRRSAGRQNAFIFAQGAVVGAMGNLFASALGHFIDRSGGIDVWRDGAWLGLLAISLGLILSMTVGAIQRFRQNTGVEAIFVRELERRGGKATDDGGDPDDFLEMGPPS